MRIPVVFYRADSGAEPVRDWLKALPANTPPGDLALARKRMKEVKR